MAYALSYPQTRYTPEPLVDFNSAEERKRLSGSALIGFFKMMEIWKVRDEDARTLLGGISNGPFYELKKNPKGKVLDVDRMFRVSYLLGIFKAINIARPGTGRRLGATTQQQRHVWRKDSFAVHDRWRLAGHAKRAPSARRPAWRSVGRAAILYREAAKREGKRSPASFCHCVQRHASADSIALQPEGRERARPVGARRRDSGRDFSD